MQAQMVAIEEKIKQKDAEVAELKTLETQTRSGGSPLHKKLLPSTRLGQIRCLQRFQGLECGPSHPPDSGPHCIVHAATRPCLISVAISQGTRYVFRGHARQFLANQPVYGR